MPSLNLDELRSKNLTRCLRWHPDGIHSWSLSDWMTAACGELGEAANVIKKLNRLRDGMIGNQGEDADKEVLLGKLSDEIADVVIYLDLLAKAAGIDLSNAIIGKFNEVSIRNGFPERL